MKINPDYISPWLLIKRQFYGASHVDEKSVLKNGFVVKKPAIFVLNVATKFFGVL